MNAFSAVLAASGVESLLHAGATGVFEPTLRSWDYLINSTWPNLSPVSHEAIEVFTDTNVSWEQCAKAWRQQGIDAGERENFFYRLPPGVGPNDERRRGFPPPYSADNPANLPHLLWYKYITSKQTPPPLESLIAFKLLGRQLPGLTDDETAEQLDEWIRRYGIREPLSNWLIQKKPYIISPEDSRILFNLQRIYDDSLKETLTEAQVIDLFARRRNEYTGRLAAAGVVHDDDKRAFNDMVQPPTYNEAIELAQRDLLVGQDKNFNAEGNPPDDRGTAKEQRAEFNRLMVLEGFTDPKIIDYLWALRQRLPTEGELIEAAVKNAFVGPLVKILGLDQEYHTQPQFIVGTDKLGLSGSPKISQADMTTHILNHKLVKGNEYEGKELEADETDDEAKARAEKYYNAQDPSLLTWAQVFWRSHWVNLSPEQIYECLQRQRVIDTTKAGGAAGLRDYKNAIAELDFPGNPNNTPETRYAIACFYALTTLPFAVTLPDGTVLEAGSAGKGLGRNPDVPPVTMDIVSIVLRSNDYAPLYRRNLADIAYKVLRLVDIRWIAQRSLRSQTFARSAIGYDEQIGKDLPDEDNGGAGGTGAGPTPLQKFVFAWCRENFLDRGQSEPSAQSLATLATSMAATSNKVQIRPLTRLYERAYRVGLIDAPRYAQLLKYAGQRVYESGGRAVPQKVPRGEGLIAGLEPGVVEDMGVYTGLNPSVPGIGLEPGVVGEMSLRDLLLQDTGVYTLQPLQDLTVEGKLASFADIADKDLDIFDISDMEADLYDDVGAAAYVDEQDSIDAAQDQLESEIDALTGP